MRLWGNDYSVRESAGAFGDLGTLIPFLVGYLTLTKLDPVGVLVVFGVFKIVAGLYFRTPMPTQRASRPPCQRCGVTVPFAVQKSSGS
jgi:hypothetical protein